jgi:hypothetical protein
MLGRVRILSIAKDEKSQISDLNEKIALYLKLSQKMSKRTQQRKRSGELKLV